MLIATHANCLALEVVSASRRDQDEDAGESVDTPQLVLPQDRLLESGKKGLYALTPVPSALKADLAKAFSIYVNQQWSKSVGFFYNHSLVD